MRFESPEFLFAFLVLGLVVFVAIIKERRRFVLLKKNFSTRNLKKMKIDYEFNFKNFIARASFFTFLACVIFALARPQSGQIEREETSSEHSVVFLIDLSRSMLSRDISPSRLRLTKKEISKAFGVLDSVKVGLVAFAGSASVISPMTSDLSALEIYLDSLSTDTIGSQGTEIFAALEEAKLMFERVSKKEKLKKKTEKIIVLFSDGENHQTESLDKVKEMASEGFRVFTVGVGSPDGGFIPEFDGAKEYIRSNDGQAVVSKPNFKFLKELARKGKGAFYSLNPIDPFAFKLKKDLQSIDSESSSKKKFVVKGELFQTFLYVGLFFFLLFAILRRKR